MTAFITQCNFFDLFLFLLAVLFVLLGAKAGFLPSFFYVGSGFAGMWVSTAFSARLHLNFYFLFILAVIAVLVLSLIVRGWLSFFALTIPDKILGAVFGGLVAVLFIKAAVTPFKKWCPKEYRPVIASSFYKKKLDTWMCAKVPPLKHFDYDVLKKRFPPLVSKMGKPPSDVVKEWDQQKKLEW